MFLTFADNFLNRTGLATACLFYFKEGGTVIGDGRGLLPLHFQKNNTLLHSRYTGMNVIYCPIKNFFVIYFFRPCHIFF